MRKILEKMKIWRKIQQFGLLKVCIMLFYYAPKYLILKYLLRRKYYHRRIYDYKLCLDLNDSGVSRHVAIKGTREEQLRYIMLKCVKKGDAVLDLGANIGYYVIMEAKLVGEEGHVYALEPSPENYDLLCKNVEFNKVQSIVSTYQLGGSNKSGKEKFYISELSNLHTFIPKLYGSTQKQKGVTDKYIEVPVTNLSTFIEDKRPIDLIRMDIEGYEVEVFEGLEKAIKSNQFKGKILFEVHRPKYDDTMHSMRKQLKMLFDYGYSVSMMTSSDESVSTIKEKYKAIALIQTNDTRYRGIYENISREDSLLFICDKGGVRDVLLEKMDD